MEKEKLLSKLKMLFWQGKLNKVAHWMAHHAFLGVSSLLLITHIYQRGKLHEVKSYDYLSGRNDNQCCQQQNAHIDVHQYDANINIILMSIKYSYLLLPIEYSYRSLMHFQRPVTLAQTWKNARCSQWVRTWPYGWHSPSERQRQDCEARRVRLICSLPVADCDNLLPSAPGCSWS